MKVKKTKPLLILAVLFLLCSVTAIGISFGWLTSKRDIGSDNMDLQMQANGIFIDCYQVYQCDETGYLYGVDADSSQVPDYVAVASGNYTMKAYDSIFTDSNDYHGLIYAVKLCNIPKGASAVRATLSCSSEDAEDYAVSNIVDLGYLKADMTFNVASASSETLHVVRKNIINSGNSRTFRTNQGSTSAKNTAVSFDITLSDEEKNAGTAVLLFLLDYDPDLITRIDPFTSESSDLFSTGMSFPNDLTEFLFEPVL